MELSTNKYDDRYLKATVTQTKGTSEQNYSTINWTVESLGGSGYYTVYHYGLWINDTCVWGGEESYTQWDKKVFPAKIGSTSGSLRINHNSDGSVGNVSVRLKGCIYNFKNENFYGTLYMSSIARYFSLKPGFSLSSKNETSATFNWLTSETASGIQYKINSGSWVDVTTDANARSGSFTVPGLLPGTGYTIYLDAKRKDSGLWAQDKPLLSVTTYSYPYISSTPDFKIGDTLTIGIYNPLGRECQVWIKNPLGTEVGGDKTSSTSISGYTYDAFKNNLYAGIPNSESGQYQVRLIVASVSRDTTVQGGTYRIRKEDFEKPLFDSSYISNIQNTHSVYNKISGTNKFIKGHNTLSGIIKPMNAQKYANPDYYNITSSGISSVKKKYSSSNISFDIQNALVSNIINILAVDKRGLSRNVELSVDLVDYSNPGIISSKIVRQDGIGQKAILEFVGSYTDWENLLQSNTIKSIQYRFKKISEANYPSTWNDLPENKTLIISDGRWDLNCVLTDNFITTEQYNIQLKISDLLETIITGDYVISTANGFLWRDLANKRLGINKKPTEALDVAGNIKSSGNIEAPNIKGNALYINGVKMLWYE